VGAGVGFMYVKTSNNWLQKCPADRPDVGSNQVAISSEKNSLFYCKVCWVTFQTEDELNQHSVLHSGEKQFVWQMVPTGLGVNCMAYSANRFVYKLCGKQFQQVCV
jgi:hypothetical protein